MQKKRNLKLTSTAPLPGRLLKLIRRDEKVPSAMVLLMVDRTMFGEASLSVVD